MVKWRGTNLLCCFCICLAQQYHSGCADLHPDLCRMKDKPLQTLTVPSILPGFPKRDWGLEIHCNKSEMMLSMQSRPLIFLMQCDLLARKWRFIWIEFFFSFFFIGDIKVKFDFAGFMAWSITLLRTMIPLSDLEGHQLWNLIWWPKHIYNTTFS